MSPGRVACVVLLAYCAPLHADMYLCQEAGRKVFRNSPCANPAQTLQAPPAAARKAAVERSSAQTSEAALSMVRKLRLSDHLMHLGLQAASASGTYRLILQQAGEAAAQSLLKGELEQLLPAYRERWDAHLARAYAENFSAEVLISVRDEMDTSKYFGALAARQDAISRSVQSRAAELLAAYVDEALKNAVDQAARPE